MLPIHGPIHSEFFYLRSTESVMDFLNITEIVSAKQDEEVWVEIQSYRDRKHRDETMANMEKDKNCESRTNNIYLLLLPDLALL